MLDKGNGDELERAIRLLPTVEAAMAEHERGARMNAKFVLTAAMVRSIMYVLLGGAGVYLASVTAGDTQHVAIYKGLGAAVTAAVARLGLEGGYDALRARAHAIKKGDVGAYSMPIHDGQGPNSP